MIPELNERSQAVLRYIIDAYMETGDPVGSRIISKELALSLSAATIRNVMADLEDAGLLYSPHTSAGRMPTQEGLRLYVDGLMEVGNLSADEQNAIDAQCHSTGQSTKAIMEQATGVLSGLSSAASLVVAPKSENPVNQIQFVKLDTRRVLVVLVMKTGLVENRIMETDEDIPQSALVQASNYMTAKLSGKTLGDARTDILQDIRQQKQQLGHLTQDLIARGIALEPETPDMGHIIVRGQSHLLKDIKAIEDLEHARKLMQRLEEQETAAALIENVNIADGIQIFIGTENRIFEHSGWSMVLSPYRSKQNKIIGAIGVIGPSRINYSRIIPMLDYTSKVVQRLLDPDGNKA